jgi:hypothetical protein
MLGVRENDVRTVIMNFRGLLKKVSLFEATFSQSHYYNA